MSATPVQQSAHLFVDLPAGGRIPLMTIEEVDLWNESRDKYIADYQLVQQNDLNLLGAVLIQQIQLFRSQQVIAGMEAEVDGAGVPTGRYVARQMKAAEIAKAQSTLIKASDEIQKIEKSLGIDKATREKGGAHTVQNYILSLKAAARDYGIHLAERTLAYEKVCMDARQRLRILKNADDEDKAYHQITPENICDWLFDELGMLEELDKQYAAQKGKLYVGQV